MAVSPQLLKGKSAIVTGATSGIGVNAVSPGPTLTAVVYLASESASMIMGPTSSDGGQLARL